MSRGYSTTFRDSSGLRWQWILAVILLGVAAAIYVIIYAINYVEERSCAVHAAELHVEHRYDFFEGCRVRLDDGRYVPLDLYRLNEDVPR